MTSQQFCEGMHFLAAGLCQTLEQKTIEVYFELLGDLPHDAFLQACRTVLLSHKWNTFPSIAELREAAVSFKRGKNASITPAEAWALAWEAASEIDMDIRGPYRVYTGNGEYTEYDSQQAAVMSRLPAPVAKAMEMFGLREICYGDDPTGVIRGQFMKMFDQIAESDTRREMLPPSMREAIGGVLAGIGDLPT